MQTMMFASIKKAIANYSRTSDLKLHNGHGTALDEDLFSAKHVYTVGSDKQLHAFCPATNKIDASHTFKHKLTDCAVYNMPGGEDKIDTLVVADDHKHLFLVQYHQDSRKFVIDFEHSFDDSVHSLCIHPIGTVLFGLKKDKSWFVFDLSEKKLIYEKADKGLHLTSLALHPDGNLLAVGDSHGKLHFIEILSNEEMMVFDTNYFSENGYYILVGTREGNMASVWDLRPNYMKSIKDFEMEAGIDALSFDRTGKYIMISAGGLHLIEASKFALQSSFKLDGPPLAQLKFGKLNARIMGIHNDGSLSVYS